MDHLYHGYVSHNQRVYHDLSHNPKKSPSRVRNDFTNRFEELYVFHVRRADEHSRNIKIQTLGNSYDTLYRRFV